MAWPAMRHALFRLSRFFFRLIRDTFRYVSFRPSQKRGVYPSFSEAELAAPQKKLGYNNRELAEAYGQELELRLDSSDFPVLFHLQRILSKKPCTILDFGGNVGTHYLRYRKYLDLDGVRWIVCDVPEITRVGREKCAGMDNITFVSDIAEIEHSHVDVFLACDSIQYVDVSSPAVLMRRLMERCGRPAHILLDLLPLYEGVPFVTLQNGGPVYYPQHVFNREEFISSIAKLGYVLDDAWDNRHDACIIPFHPERSFHAYSGLYLRDSAD